MASFQYLHFETCPDRVMVASLPYRQGNGEFLTGEKWPQTQREVPMSGSVNDRWWLLVRSASCPVKCCFFLIVTERTHFFWGRGHGKPGPDGTGGTGTPKAAGGAPPASDGKGKNKGGKGTSGKKQCRGCWKMLPVGSFPPGKDFCWMDNRALDNIYKRAKASNELAWWSENRHDDKKRTQMLAKYHELHPETKDESKAEATVGEAGSSKVKPGKGRQRGRGMFDIAKFKESVTTASELMMDRYCKDYTRAEFEKEKVNVFERLRHMRHRDTRDMKANGLGIWPLKAFNGHVNRGKSETTKKNTIWAKEYCDGKFCWAVYISHIYLQRIMDFVRGSVLQR